MQFSTLLLTHCQTILLIYKLLIVLLASQIVCKSVLLSVHSRTFTYFDNSFNFYFLSNVDTFCSSMILWIFRNTNRRLFVLTGNCWANIGFIKVVLETLIKSFLKKDLFTERRTTVCYSNYRIMDCKVFLVPPHFGWKKRTRLFLLASDWTKW